MGEKDTKVFHVTFTTFPETTGTHPLFHYSIYNQPKKSMCTFTYMCVVMCVCVCVFIYMTCLAVQTRPSSRCLGCPAVGTDTGPPGVTQGPASQLSEAAQQSAPSYSVNSILLHKGNIWPQSEGDLAHLTEVSSAL